MKAKLYSAINLPGVADLARVILLLIFFSSFSYLNGYGQILSYTTSTTGALNAVASNANGTTLARVNGPMAPGSPCSTGFSSTNFSTATTYSSTLSAVETSVSPVAGYKLSVTGFQADLRRSSTGPASLRFAYSVDGGSTWIDQGSNQTNPSANCNAGSTLSWATPLSVNAPATLKFRIYGFGASSTSGTEQILNLLINGTVVPVSSCVPPVITPVVTSVSCSGGNNGAVTLNLTGGSTPFTYLWSNGAITQNISGLATGTYSVTITANGGCSATASTNVSQPAVFTATISAQINTGCTGNTGSATVTPAGGSAPYNYVWSNGQSSDPAINLATGTYVVTVKDANLCTATVSAIIVLMTPAPLTVTGISNTNAVLNWTAVAGAVGYNVQYRKIGTNTWTSANSLTTSLNISGLTAGTAYEFQVQTVCSGNVNSSFSASGTFSTTGGIGGCGVATVLSASNITGTSAKLNWNVVLGGVSYNVEYRVVGTNTWTTGISTTNSLAITGLTAGTTYQFQVQTRCAAGLGTYSAPVSFTTGPACPIPTGLTISNITNTTATFNWAAVTGAASYNVRYRVIGTTTWTTATTTATTLSVSGLTAATNYTFQVQTVCSGNVPSGFSISGTFITNSGNGTCAIPTGVTITGITSIAALANWTAVNGAIRYNVQYKQTGTNTWISDTAAAVTYGISGLSPSTTYVFEVQTLCSGNITSGWSVPDTFTTLGPCGSPPSGFLVTNITATSASLTWTSIIGAVSYNIQYRITGTNTWTSTTSATSTKNLTGLTAGVTYEFQVKTVCTVGSSSFSTSSLFSTSAALPRPDHVVVVIMENHSYSNIIGSSAAPYINSLLTDTDASTFNHSYAIEHPSQPNYLDFFSGSNQGMTSDNLPGTFPFTTANLGRELEDSLLTFTTFSEDLPSVGFNGATSGNYARKHNPGANWMGTGTNDIPTTTNQPFSAFPTSANYASLPTVCYVVPNLINDMHNGSGNSAITAGDTWLNTNISPYVRWAETHNSLLILTWDEDDLSSNNQILTIFAGQMVKSGTDTSQINHYNVLRTIEDMYKLGHAGSASQATPITNCWKTTQQSNASVCDWSLWSHVYNNYRLIIHDTCTYITGTVDHLIYEADGDIHIRVNVDTAFKSMINSMNVSGQYGDLVVEPICATTVTQSDAVSSCVGFTNTVYIPNVGEHVKVTGSYVTDNVHGWNEIHPITTLVISTQTSQPVRTEAYTGINDVFDDDYIAVTASPNPTSDFLNFNIGKRANVLTYIEIMDGLGRNAGQYQLYATNNLEITTSYLPAGIYYYNVKQNDRVMNSGRFVVVH